MTAGATIGDLAAHPEYAEIVAFWVDREWAIFSKRSFAETLARYRDTPGPGKLPITLVALVGGHPCGVASLREKDSFAPFGTEIIAWLAAGSAPLPPMKRWRW